MNRLSKLSLVLCFLLAGPGLTSAQNMFLAPGQSGLGLGARGGTGENFSSLGAVVNYSLPGQVDLGLAFSRSWLADEVIGPDGSATEFSPYLTLAVVRPSRASSFGLELGLSYAQANYASDELDFLGWDMSGSAVGGGALFYFKVQSSPTLTLFPAFTTQLVRATAEIEDAFGHKHKTEVDDLAVGASLSLLLNQKVYITPAVQSFDGNSSLNLTIGFLIPGSE